MERLNQSCVKEFIFLGFSTLGEHDHLLFWVFLAMYMTTLSGNLMIVNIVCLDTHLRDMPMYFFLVNLSLLDMCYTSAIMPKMLGNFWVRTNTISYDGCLAQMFFFDLCTGTECILLALMSYDRYAAVCHPLRYTAIMNHKVCLHMAACSWGFAMLNSLLHTTMTAHLSFCGPNEIQHYFCDVPPLLRLSCSDIHTNKVVLFIITMFFGLSPCDCIIASYSQILSAILKIQSSSGRSKAFSTCSSHLTVVILFYGTGMFIYVHPSFGTSPNLDLLASVFYSIVTPMMNPLIYCLRNQEVKVALRKIIQRNQILHAVFGRNAKGKRS